MSLLMDPITYAREQGDLEGLPPGHLPPALRKALLQQEDIELDRVILDGKKLTNANVTESLTSARVVRTIEGASILELTVHDQARKLVESSIFKNRVQIEIDDLFFTLVKNSKSGDDFPLTFEDRAVANMRRYNKFRKVNRNKVTRAEFARMLVREVRPHRIKFYCPILHKEQTIGRSTKPNTKRKVSRVEGDRKRGLNPNDNVKMKGFKATPYQMHNAEIALNEGTKLKVNERVMLALIVAGIGESNFKEVVNSLGYGGVFQGQVATGGRYFTKYDTAAMARCFLLGGKGFQAGGAINLEKQGLDPGTIATRVEASGKPGSFYGVYLDEAKAILAAYGGAGGDTGSEVVTETSRTVNKKYEFTRGTDGKKENTWNCLGRLADEVRWRRFMVANTLYFIPESYLFKTRPRMVISEDDAAVDYIDYELDVGHEAAELTVSARANRWDAPPGSVIKVKDPGPSNGRWLVTTIERNLFESDVNITLKKPIKDLPEPPPETKTITKRSKKGSPGSNDGTGKDSGKFIFPVQTPNEWSGSLTSPFGQRGGRLHDGIDIGVPTGTPVKAVRSGKVTQAGWYGGYGNYVAIAHEGGLLTFYGHNSSLKVRAGQRVSQGQVIALSGNTGHSTGPHLHFGVHRNGQPVNPASYL